MLVSRRDKDSFTTVIILIDFCVLFALCIYFSTRYFCPFSYAFPLHFDLYDVLLCFSSE